MKQTFVILGAAWPRRDRSRTTREQPLWDEHARFVDDLVAAGFILMGGPLPDEDGAMLIVAAEDEREARARLSGDPWFEHGVLELRAIHRWEIFIDARTGTEGWAPAPSSASDPR